MWHDAQSVGVPANLPPAWHCWQERAGVCAGQIESRLAVVELRAVPLRRGVANGAILREAGLQVIGAVRRLIVLHVAAIAIGRRARESSSHVALGASHCRVSSGQRELGRIVIKVCALPAAGRMAGVAFGRKLRLNVIGIGGVLEIGKMAARAIGRCAGELAAHMAGRALHRGMRARQRKGRGVVIERRTLPAHKAVAQQAIVRETGGDVIRILRRVEILHVAAVTIHRCSGIASTHVALCALQTCVSSHQGKIREPSVIELRALPAVHAMADLAIGGQVRRHVTGRLRLLVVG